MALLGKILIFLFLFLIFSPGLVVSQPFQFDDIDSLRKISLKANPTEKVKCLNWISELYWQRNIDSSIFYANKALALSVKYKNKIGMAFAYNNLGGSYFYKNDYYQAIKFFNKSLEFRRELGQKQSEEAVLGNLSSIYINMCIYDKALDYNYMVLRISEEIQDSAGIATAYFLNAFIYEEQDMHEKAITLYQKALTFFKKYHNKSFYASSLNNIGSIYLSMGKIPIAYKYLSESLNTAKSINDLYSIAFCTDNIGRYYTLTRKFDSAIICHHKAIGIMNSIHSADVAEMYINLANVYLEQNQVDSSEYYLHLAYTNATSSKQKSKLLNIYKLYTHLFEKTNRPQKALEYLKLYNDVKDSILSEKNINKLLDKQIDYETEKYNAEKLIQELKIKRNKNQRNFSILTAILIFTITIILFSRYRLRKRTNLLLIEKNNELEIANNTKDKLFAIVAHDLKNHLTAFQTVTQSLSENFIIMDDNRKKHFITRLYQSAQSLYGMMDTLLTWSFSQLKRIRFEPEMLCLKEIADKSINEIQILASRKNTFILNNIDPEIQVFADANLIMNVFRNLIINAIKFSPEASPITLNAKRSPNETIVSIADTGSGISEEDIKKLFRIDVNHKTIGNSKEKGTGLGLVICKDFINLHHGKIWAESIEGQGSTFYFSIPAINEHG